ncbi:hypothetical protein Zmor_012121 [Zophobas morio]|uniref:Uncharacterized protein n=1 Tax=Zophobas morio TaxID=2755281 RepID=A0AA38LZW1_9CUCU|nr:hypothetical protein Zmor_012121 [Zophobas morio]
MDIPLKVIGNKVVNYHLPRSRGVSYTDEYIKDGAIVKAIDPTDKQFSHVQKTLHSRLDVNNKNDSGRDSEVLEVLSGMMSIYFGTEANVQSYVHALDNGAYHSVTFKVEGYDTPIKIQYSNSY